MLVGLTGGIASGKSTATAEFRRCGAEIIDLDVLAREVVEPGQPAYQKIVARFGADAVLVPAEVDPRRPIDRARLGAIVFASEADRRFLNSVTHPEIYKTVLWRLFLVALCRLGIFRSTVVVIDAPLLFEAKALAGWMSETVLVYVPRNVQLARLRRRNPDLSQEDAHQRISAQMSLEEKRKLASTVIDNTGDAEDLQGQVRTEFRVLQGKSRVRAVAAALAVAIPVVVMLCATACRLWG